MSRLPISANLVVRNEGHRIRETLERLREYVSEIIVVDQDSDDNTVEQIQPYADVLIFDKRWGRCEPSRHKAANISQHPWILVVDADEYLTETAWTHMPRIVKDSSGIDLVHYVISNHVGGEFVQSDLMACPRLVRRGRAFFPTELHSIITPVLGARVHVEDDYIGFIHEKSVDEQQQDWDRYSQIEGVPRGTWIVGESRYS